MNIEIELEEVENKYIFRLQGRIDAITSPVLETKINQLIDQKRHNILLDFTNIEYLSSAGLRLLLSASKKLQALQGRLVIFALADEVLEIVKMAGFERVLSLAKQERDALKLCS